MNAKIQKFQYDKTIEARVVSTKQKAEGIYKVEFEDAIFDAYSNDNSRYYEDDTVYVHVPKGDFSQQKHIVGRKVDIEKEPERTFTFKMPFDDFLSLEDLTYQDAQAEKVHGYIANHPLHGTDNDTINYNDKVIDINANLQELQTAFKKAITMINAYEIDFAQYMTPIANGYTLVDQYPSHSTKSYLTIIEELLARDCKNLVELNQVVNEVKQQILLGLKNYGDYNKYINQDEYNKILEMIGADQAIITDTYQDFLDNLNSTAEEYQTNVTNSLSSAELENEKAQILSDDSLNDEQRQQALEELQKQQDALRQAEMSNIINSNVDTSVDVEIQEKENDIEWPDYYKALIEEQGITIDNNIGAKGRLINKLTNQYKEAEKELQNSLMKYALLRADQEGAKASNINWLYTWVNEDNSPCLFDQLGVAADFQTLLGDYRPRRGTYGLKLIVRGMTKPTEELASVERTETLYFLNTVDFYGNTYAFYNYYTQQKLFDVSGFQKLNRIDVYFWQDHREEYAFKDEQMADIPWHVVGPTGDWQDCPPNIMVTNIKLLMGVDANSFDTDKVFLYTYDSLNYGINPYIETSRAVEDNRTLQFAWVHKLEDGTAELINKPEKLKDYNANIYWYQYEYGVAQDVSVYAWRQGGINWKWLENQCSIENEQNVYNKFSINVQPDIAKAQEKYRVVLEYNSVPLRSDPLVFTNVDQNIETHADDLVNEIVFRFLREDADGNLIEDNNIGVFNVYDQSNLCIKDENNISYAAKWYYVQIWIRNNDNGEYTPLAIDDVEDNVDIVWGTDELQNFSMINQFVAPTVSDLQNAVLLPTSTSYVDSVNQHIVDITRKFNIRNRLDMRYTHNNITAVVRRNGREYRLQKTLYFGQSGSMGSEYTISLHQLLPQGNCMVDNEPFSIYATVADKFGNKVENQAYHFTWELLSPTIITKGKNDPIVPDEDNDLTEPLTWQNSIWTTGQEGNYADNKISGVIRNGMPLIIRVGVLNAADYPIYQTTGFRLVDKSGFNNLYNISVPDRVEFRADGKAPIAITTPFYVSDIQDAEDDIINEYYPKWKLRQWYKPTYSKEWTELVDENNEPSPDFFSLNERLVAKKEIATNQNPYLWADFTDDDGTIPDYDGRVSTEAFDGGKQVRYNYLLNYIEAAYNQANITYLSSAQNENDTAVYNEEKEKYEQYLDKLNLATSKIVPSHTTYALNPYINTNATANVAWYWDDALAENYYTIIEFQNDKDLPYYVRQAIAMTRNEYSSSLVNSWDGSLLIDKENNAFLSKMVSAGSKDQNNRFTGVMMGDWQDNADASMQDVGLYGFNKGVQVFGLKSDGTGFIGKVGKGQITFDGNYALISNYDKSCYINLDPIRTTDSNVLDPRTTMGYSPYFLYAKVPKTSTATVQGEGDLLQSTYWVRSFMADTENDYFIVDPNNGVLTTGGIIARYGKIGNWLISASGLYQRHTKRDEYGNSLYDTNGHIMTDRFMYLGYPDIDIERENAIRAKYQGAIDSINAVKQRELELEQAKLSQQVVELLGEKYAKQIFTVDPLHYFNYGTATLLVANYLEECKRKFNETYTTSENESEVLLNIIYNADNLVSVINIDNAMVGYHKHYRYNQDTDDYEPVYHNNTDLYTPYYTGCALIYIPLLGYPTNAVKSEEVASRLRSMGYDPSYSDYLYTVINFDGRNQVQTVSYGIWNREGSTIGDFKETEYYTSFDNAPSEWLSDDAANFRNQIENNATSTRYPYVRSISRSLTNLTVEDLQKYIDAYRKIYEWYLAGYNTMLREMLEAGLNSLTDEQMQEFLQEKQDLEELYNRNIIDKINKKYNAQLQEIEKQIQKELNDITDEDRDRYAIYCGEDDIVSSTLYTDPVSNALRPNNAFFTVDWTGTLMARKGVLGYTAPWVIDDNGLTQKNKYGIIYLGAPKYSMDENYDPYKTVNGVDYNGRQSTSTIENNANDTLNAQSYNTYDQFIMFAGPKIAATYNDLDQVSVPEHYASTIDEAYFALRADGTLFSRRGRIGSWYIGDTVLQTLWKADTINAGYPYNIVFDAYNAQIRMGGGRTIIYGDGRIVLSNPSEGINRNTGTIELAGYSLQGWTVNNSRLNNYSLTEYDAATLEGQQALASFNGGTWDWSYSGAGSTDYSGAEYTMQTVNTMNVNAAYGTIVNPNYFSIFEKDLDNGVEYAGVQMVTGQLADMPGQYGVVFYPTGAYTNSAVLGLPSKPWNIHAGQINAGSIKTNNLVLKNGPLFINGEKAAVEPWVWNLYLDLLGRIKDLGDGSEDGLKKAKSGGDNIGAQLAELFNNSAFLTNIDLIGTIIFVDKITLTYTPHGDGGNGDGKNVHAQKGVQAFALKASNISYASDGTVAGALDSHGDDINDLKDQTSDLDDRVSDLEDQVSGLSNQVSDLADQISGLEDDLSSAQSSASVWKRRYIELYYDHYGVPYNG